MSKRRLSIQNILFNVALLSAGAVLLFLLYAFAARNLMPRTDPIRAVNPAGLVGQIIQVEVRNGAGVAGLAGEVTRHLRSSGFDVVESGNHSVFNEPESFVIDRVGDQESARKVAGALGIPPERVIEDVRLDLFLDASVIIGTDYERLAPFRK